MSTKSLLLLGSTLLLIPSCTGGQAPTPETAGEASVDERSYTLGGIGAFSEMVGAGVKELALSAPMDPHEVDALLSDARRIATSHQVELFRETQFLVTDLFPRELTEGKEVLLIYRGETLEKYMALTAEKRQLQEAGRYEGAARSDLARRFGGLLSYPEAKIEALLAGSTDP
jgi:hypothetical protein